MITARCGLGLLAIWALCASAFVGEAPDATRVDVTGGPAADQIVEWMPVPSGDVWLEGIPGVHSLDETLLARPALSIPGADPVTTPAAHGPLKLRVQATVPPADGPVRPDPWAAPTTGDRGDVKGRVDYDLQHWQVYGGAGLGITTGSRPASFSDKVEVGTYYKLSPALYGGKIGGGVEVNNLTERKTRLEYRQSFGDTEGFLAAEHTRALNGLAPGIVSPETPLPTPTTAIRAGLNRKF